MMDWFSTPFLTEEIYTLEVWIDEWFFTFAMAFLLVELLILAFRKKLSLNLLGDTVTNLITLAAFFGIAVLFFGAYIGTLYWFYENLSFTTLEITPWAIALAVLIADFIYYWEHRFMHRVGFGWATHTVHHSSPYFNISVAYRFGPLDGILPLFFHLPMAMLGFNPFLILFAETIVQLYQTALHTRVIGKLPRWYEAVMNTPSHHRVHHGSNPQYIDKNYAGILIVWDRMFGTFEAEGEKVVYGITTPLDSVNPFTVFFHGVWKLFQQMLQAKRFTDVLGYFFMPPGWTPKSREKSAESKRSEATR